MSEGAFQQRMENYRAVVELTASNARRTAISTATADDQLQGSAGGTVTSLLDRLFDGSLGQSGMAA